MHHFRAASRVSFVKKSYPIIPPKNPKIADKEMWIVFFFILTFFYTLKSHFHLYCIFLSETSRIEMLGWTFVMN